MFLQSLLHHFSNGTMAYTPAIAPVVTAGQVESRVLNGALVDFGPGADVLGMKHSSDYSAIHFSCKTALRTAGDIVTYMYAFFQEPVTLSRVHVLTGPDVCPVVAHVQVKDPAFAARVQSESDRYSKLVPQSRSSVRRVPVEIGYETSLDPAYMADIRLHLLKDRHARLRLGPGPAAPECAVCLTEAEDPYLTPCGHRYCRACFVGQCSSVTKKQEIPLRCLGDSGKCSRIFLLPELKHLLPADHFDQLLTKSANIHFRTITTINPCPTPDCPQTHRATTDGSVLTCAACSVPICTTCHSPSHSGLTCATYQSANHARLGSVKGHGRQSPGFDGGEDTIRKCPRCRNLVEKAGGCDRMECRCCWAGFCWRCMEVWDAAGRCACLRERGKGGV